LYDDTTFRASFFHCPPGDYAEVFVASNAKAKAGQSTVESAAWLFAIVLDDYLVILDFAVHSSSSNSNFPLRTVSLDRLKISSGSATIRSVWAHNPPRFFLPLGVTHLKPASAPHLGQGI
jgi:hypothetical protein